MARSAALTLIIHGLGDRGSCAGGRRHDAVTIGAVHSFRASARDYIDYLVREDGVILGSGVGAVFAYRARRVVTLISVLAGQRRRGAGTALYEAISRWASERGAGELEVSVSGNDPESL